MDEEILPAVLPYSVIVSSHGNQLRNIQLDGLDSIVFDSAENGIGSVPLSSMRADTLLQQSEDVSTESASNVLVSVYEIGPKSKTDLYLKPRVRRLKRPYSPELITFKEKKPLEKKHKSTTQAVLKSAQNQANSGTFDTRLIKPFLCDKCKSPFIVDPSRSRLPLSKSKRKPCARKIIDNVTKSVLVVCNACGLATGQKRKQRGKPSPVPPTDEAKVIYIRESVAFAKLLAETLREPEVERIFCPTFKTKPCGCLQKYVNGKAIEDESREQRVLHLLAILKEAVILSKQKNVADLSEDMNNDNVASKSSSHKGRARPRRTQAFEKFVLSKRLYLRDDLGLCERACQRILKYSNNFLHKKVKSVPNKGPRVERTIGRNACGTLKPIADISHCNCCHSNCVMLALTHPKLLESWRLTSSLGQRQARRVLAEMLTPTGGTKGNCFKFIAMVTGCSYTTISLVNNHMRRTQGDRDPPEHGLKKWWREQSRLNGTSIDSDVTSDQDDDPCPEATDVHIPTREELRMMGPEQASQHLQRQRDKLLQLQQQLANQQSLLEQQQQMLDGPCVLERALTTQKHHVLYNKPSDAVFEQHALSNTVQQQVLYNETSKTVLKRQQVLYNETSNTVFDQQQVLYKSNTVLEQQVLRYRTDAILEPQELLYNDASSSSLDPQVLYSETTDSLLDRQQTLFLDSANMQESSVLDIDESAMPLNSPELITAMKFPSHSGTGESVTNARDDYAIDIDRVEDDLTSSQFLHILKLPTSSSYSVTPAMSFPSSPTSSIVTSLNEFDALGNIVVPSRSSLNNSVIMSEHFQQRNFADDLQHDQ